MRPFRLLIRDILVYGLMGGLSMGVGFILLPILTRQFTTDEYGILQIAVTLTSLLSIVMLLQMESSLARFWTARKEDHSTRSFVNTTFIFVLLWGGGLFLLICIFSPQLAKVLFSDRCSNDLIVLAAIAALLQAFSVLPQIILRMERRIVRYNLLSLAQTVCYVSATLALIFLFDGGVAGALAATGIGYGLSLVIGLLWVSDSWGGRISFSLLKEPLRFSLPLFPAVFVTWLNSQADRFMLLVFMGLGAVGIFGSASKLAFLMLFLIGIFRQAWMPLSMSLVDKPDVRNDFYRRVLLYYCALMTVVALFVAAFSRELLGFLVPSEYLGGYQVIPWLLGAQIIHGAGSITNLGMVVTNRTAGNSIAAWTGAIVNLLCGLVLIPKIGIWGAALGSFIAELISVSMMWRFSIKVSDIRFDTMRILFIVFCYILAAGVILLAYEHPAMQEYSVWIRIVCFGVASCVVARISFDSHLKVAIAGFVNGVTGKHMPA